MVITPDAVLWIEEHYGMQLPSDVVRALLAPDQQIAPSPDGTEHPDPHQGADHVI